MGSVDNTSDANKPISNATQTTLNGKANSSHTHAATDVTQDSSHRFVTDSEKSTWNGKANASHGTHVSFSSTAPKMDGAASAGSVATVARSDHVHPVDTSRAAASHTHSGYLSITANVTPGIIGVLPIANGGTGASTAASARTHLGAASSSHTHSNYMTKSNPTGTGNLSINRKSGTTSGLYNVAMGYNCEANADFSTSAEKVGLRRYDG